MSGRLGIELTPTMLHIVEVSRWRNTIVRAIDVPWSPDEPEAVISPLREQFGRPDRVSVAVGLAFLRVARVELPPVRDEDRDDMVALEPDRFFSTGDALQTSVVPGSPIGFAVSRPWIESVTRALTTWAPIERIDPSPLAIAESLGRAAQGAFTVVAGDGEAGRITMRDGRLESVRRMPDSVEEALAVPPNDIQSVAGKYRAAYGAVLRLERPVAGTLLDRSARVIARSRARVRGGIAIVAAAAGLAFLFLAVDHARDSDLMALEREAVRLTSEAAPALAAQQRWLSMQRERAVIGETLQQRAEIAGALAAISETLPGDAVILSARAAGRRWEIEGTASNAAALVPRLDTDPRFDSVRVLSASSRFRDGNRTRESFSLAFHVQPTR